MKLLGALKSSISPYLMLARMDKPIGSLLLYIPCTWSILMSHHYCTPEESLKLLTLFGIGSVIMRGAGCTVNDLWDIKYDKLVERTKSRPLASGKIKPFNAIVFLGAQLTAG